MQDKITKILLVGQTPPPYHGQALMIERTLKGDYGKNIKLIHVRLGFSKNEAEIGKVSILKFLELFRVVFEIIKARIFQNSAVLYYFPAGPKIVPILRDIFILLSTRWLFKKTIFHFRAGGLSEYFLKAPSLMKLLMRLAYSRPDIGIRLSEYAPEDPSAFHARKEFILMNGIEDEYAEYLLHKGDDLPRQRKVKILYLGALIESKGIEYLLQAGVELKKRELPFELYFVGGFDSELFKKKVTKTVLDEDLTNNVIFTGVLTGLDKYRILASSDILCLPTFYHSEALPGVVIEAMCFKLPVVATRWRGIPSMIQDGYTGFMVPVKDAPALADKLELLIREPEKRKFMGDQGRNLYLERYTLDCYIQNLKTIFESVG